MFTALGVFIKQGGSVKLLRSHPIGSITGNGDMQRNHAFQD